MKNRVCRKLTALQLWEQCDRFSSTVTRSCAPSSLVLPLKATGVQLCKLHHTCFHYFSYHLSLNRLEHRLCENTNLYIYIKKNCQLMWPENQEKFLCTSRPATHWGRNLFAPRTKHPGECSTVWFTQYNAVSNAHTYMLCEQNQTLDRQSTTLSGPPEGQGAPSGGQKLWGRYTFFTSNTDTNMWDLLLTDTDTEKQRWIT